MGRYLHIGGVVAVGFDATGAFLLVITHSGRGVFSTATWERVARDTDLAHPVGGVGVGIGPIAGQSVPVTVMNYQTDEMRVAGPGGRFVLECESAASPSSNQLPNLSHGLSRQGRTLLGPRQGLAS
jgi:hypothetical protein